MDGSPQNLAMLIDRVGELLTDSKHPLDAAQAREMSLMLQQQTAISIQQMYVKMLEIQRTLADSKVEREVANKSIHERLVSLENYRQEFPSLTWLFRHKTKQTVTWSVGFVVLVITIFLSYQEWLLNRLGLPPILIP